MTNFFARVMFAALLCAATSASGCAFVIVGGSIHGDEPLKGSWSSRDHERDSADARTYFVVPKTLPNGQPSDTQRAALEAWLVDRAGGFTNMGIVAGAWKDDDGKVVREDNVAYLVSIDDDAEDFAEELAERIEKDFDQEEAYVEQW